MKDTLTHLPLIKQEELNAIVADISTHKKVEMVILFGSYARDNWVDDKYKEEGITYHYQSDYDLLVVTKVRHLHEQRRLKNDLEKSVDKLFGIHTLVSIIVHDADYTNEQLDEAQYFFSDIMKEGVLLYDSGKITLKEPTKELSPQLRHKLAQENYEQWFPKAVGFFRVFKMCLEEQLYNQAAFILHQATENFYNTILLVFTHYKPKVHDLKVLRMMANTVDTRFLKVFPLTTPEEKRLFELLREAYVGARYKKGYKITEEELLWLGERVKILQELTEKLCHEKMQSFLN